MSLRTVFDQTLRRIDAWPFSSALVGGVVVGLLSGTALVAGGGPAGLVGFAVVAGLLTRLAWTSAGGGVFEEERELLDMVDVPGGTFVMGSPENEPGHSEDERQHEVTLSVFRIGRTPVTKATYREFMGLDEAPGAGSDDHPVTQVAWFDAVSFCNRLSEEAGLKPCYRIRGDRVKWVRDTGYRLPTESEWEYAVRAGTSARWSFGDDEADVGRYAWFGGNSGGEAHAVATREPNLWGLHDMHGNVWEWCWDVLGDYPRWLTRNPRGPRWSWLPSSSGFRVVRGGSAWDGPELLRSAYRGWGGPGDRDEDVGFRCVCSPRRQP